MGSLPWILIAVAGLIVLLGVLAVVSIKKRKGLYKTDYYSFFIIGIIWLPFGILMMIAEKATTGLGSFFSILGLAYIVVGLVHKDKWKANRRPPAIKDPLMRWILIILLLILGLGLLAYMAFRP